MPCALPVCSTVGIWWVLPSRMRARTAGRGEKNLQRGTPSGGVAPLQQHLRHGQPAANRPRVERINACCAAGKTSTTRLTAAAVLRVCSVPKTRCPVAAASTANLDRFQVAHLAHHDDVRVLPQPGPQRRGERARVAADLTLIDHAALVGVGRIPPGPRWSECGLCGGYWRDRSAPPRWWICRSRVGPVTSTRPCGRRGNLSSKGGSPSASKLGTAAGICRNTAAAPCCCRNRLTRQRARPGAS